MILSVIETCHYILWQEIDLNKQKIVYFLKKLVGMWGCNNVDNMQYESTQNDCCLTNRFL